MGTLRNMQLTQEAISNAIDELNEIDNCRSKSMAKTKLDEAMMWVEKSGAIYHPDEEIRNEELNS